METPLSPPKTRTGKGESLWSLSWRKFRRDRLGMLSMTIVLCFALVALLVSMGWIARDWSRLGETSYLGSSTTHWFGTNLNGQDIFARSLQGVKTAFQVGLIVALSATAIGGILGALAGYFHQSLIDEAIMWLYGCLDAIPFYLFVAAVGFALKDLPFAMHIAMIATFWSSTCRIVRGEVIKIRNLEYVQAARSIGVHPLTIIFRHILPNTYHLLLIQSTIAFVSAIKSEVILTFLGLGVKDGVSWGIMLTESTNDVLRGHFGNFLAASVMLFVLIMAFNLFADALQDALDPRKVSQGSAA
jgi:ABC-type dipeptide/oligopeptide/nickel transport system permease subunit